MESESMTKVKTGLSLQERRVLLELVVSARLIGE